MHFRFIDPARHDSHWFWMCAIATDITEICSTRCDHAMPREEHVVIKRCRVTSIDVDHHLAHPFFRRTNFATIGRETKLSANRRLNAIAVEDLSFYFR